MLAQELCPWLRQAWRVFLQGTENMVKRDQEEPTKFTTEGGLVLTLHAARAVLIELASLEIEDEMRAKGKAVDPPTWTIETAGGEIETLPHVIDMENGINTLIVPDDPRETARNLAHWKLYERAQEELAERQEEAKTRALFVVGVDPFEIPEDDQGWEEDVHKITKDKVTIPGPGEADKAAERRFCYLWYYHLSPLDAQYLSMLLNLLSQGRVMSPDKVQPFLVSVRSQVEGRVWRSIESALGEATAGA